MLLASTFILQGLVPALDTSPPHLLLLALFSRGWCRPWIPHLHIYYCSLYSPGAGAGLGYLASTFTIARFYSPGAGAGFGYLASTFTIARFILQGLVQALDTSPPHLLLLALFSRGWCRLWIPRLHIYYCSLYSPGAGAGLGYLASTFTIARFILQGLVPALDTSPPHLLLLALFSRGWCRLWIPHLHIYYCSLYSPGAGAGLGYLASTVSAQEAIWYNRSLATGITAVGGGVGVILLSELRAITITAAGWRNSLLVELAFVIITFPFIYFLKPSKNRELSESQQESDLDQSSLEKSSGCNDDVETTNKNCINDETSQLVPSNPHVTHSFYRNPVLYLMIMVSLLLTNAFTAPNYYLPSRVQNDLGMSSEKSAALILITGLINIPTRFMCGWAGSYGVRVR